MNIWENDAFGVASLTDAINVLPYVPGDVGSLGIFEEEGVTTTMVTVDYLDGVLALVANTPRGAPAKINPFEKREARGFKLTHLPLDDSVLAESVQNVRAFGQTSVLQQVSSVVNRKLQMMKQHIEVTKEHLRVGALQGNILDADGATVIYNLFTEFGITEPEVDFELGTDTTDVRIKCLEAARLCEVGLQGIPYQYLMGLCSSDWFDAFISHDDVKAAWANWASNEMMRNDPRSGFAYGGIVWREYRGKVGTVDFLQPGTARVFPVGAPGMFKTYYAPADYVETVNTVGLPYYAKQEAMKFNKGIDLEAQSNPLPLPHRPQALVKCSSTGLPVVAVAADKAETPKGGKPAQQQQQG